MHRLKKEKTGWTQKLDRSFAGEDGWESIIKKQLQGLPWWRSG